MEKSVLKRRVRPALFPLFVAGLSRFAGGVFPLQLALLGRELALPLGALWCLVLAELGGVALGLWFSLGESNSAYDKTALGLFLFLCGNFLTGLSSGAFGVLAARFLVGCGRAWVERAVVLLVAGNTPAQAVPGLAYYRLLTILFDVLAPLLGAALLVRRGAGALAFLLAFFAVILLLFVLFLSARARKTHPVLGDISCERATLGANFSFFLLVACLGQWGAILLCICGGIFVFYASGNLLVAGVVLSLLQLCLLACRAVVLALKR